MVGKTEQLRVKALLTEAVTVLCKSSLQYAQKFSVEGLLGITLDDEDVFLVNINEVIDEENDGTAAKQTKQVTQGKATPTKAQRPGQRARRRRRSQQESPSGSPAAKRKAGGDASIKEEDGDDDDDYMEAGDDNMDDDAANDDGAGCSNWDNDDDQTTTTGQDEGTEKQGKEPVATEQQRQRFYQKLMGAINLKMGTGKGILGTARAQDKNVEYYAPENVDDAESPDEDWDAEEEYLRKARATTRRGTRGQSRDIGIPGLPCSPRTVTIISNPAPTTPKVAKTDTDSETNSRASTPRWDLITDDKKVEILSYINANPFVPKTTVARHFLISKISLQKIMDEKERFADRVSHGMDKQLQDQEFAAEIISRKNETGHLSLEDKVKILDFYHRNSGMKKRAMAHLFDLKETTFYDILRGETKIRANVEKEKKIEELTQAYTESVKKSLAAPDRDAPENKAERKRAYDAYLADKRALEGKVGSENQLVIACYVADEEVTLKEDEEAAEGQ